ncbi:hypothetical protein PPYR_01313 [Photinus pyralis]|uniref:N-acetylneuraminate lyase n=1 Tax=Photinus pyralis TaxID=7054 RepID=A0A1Y1KN37_PHOPY|nr:N-acetylneuraminate lyase-like isoform X1 [Photinus pyralis]KAB0804343.1 hypothetical protein PPYR_01313 [Photinus pyralis]
MEIGVRFPSYHLLMHHLEEFTKETQCKFWKRDARTIGAARSLGVTKHLNPDLIYFELKFSCVYGGVDFKTKGRNIRPRQPSLKTNGCPVFLRFKASEDGEALQLVAKNLNHNHELKLPTKKKVTSEFELSESETKRSKWENMNDTERDTYDQDDDDLKEEIVKYEGLIAPVYTPFNNDPTRSLNLEILPSYAQYLIDNGITGILINGTAGEGTVMTVEERKLVAEVWAQLCSQGQLHLMVHVGGVPLPDVLELAQHAEHIGANSILCLPELFHKPATCDDLIRYLQLVSQAAPNTPLFYYHIPSYSGVNLHMGEFLNKVQGSIPTLSGIKFTSTVLDEGYAALKACNERFTVFLGSDTVMAGAYALGFESAIATTLNMLPQFGQQIVQCIKDGNIKEAQEKQNDLNSALEIIAKHGAWVPSTKMAMNLLSPIDVGPTREPIKTLTAEEAKQMENELTSLSFITS